MLIFESVEWFAQRRGRLFAFFVSVLMLLNFGQAFSYTNAYFDNFDNSSFNQGKLGTASVSYLNNGGILVNATNEPTPMLPLFSRRDAENMEYYLFFNPRYIGANGFFRFESNNYWIEFHSKYTSICAQQMANGGTGQATLGKIDCYNKTGLTQNSWYFLTLKENSSVPLLISTMTATESEKVVFQQTVTSSTLANSLELYAQNSILELKQMRVYFNTNNNFEMRTIESSTNGTWTEVEPTARNEVGVQASSSDAIALNSSKNQSSTEGLTTLLLLALLAFAIYLFANRSSKQDGFEPSYGRRQSVGRGWLSAKLFKSVQNRTFSPWFVKSHTVHSHFRKLRSGGSTRVRSSLVRAHNSRHRKL